VKGAGDNSEPIKKGSTTESTELGLGNHGKPQGLRIIQDRGEVQRAYEGPHSELFGEARELCVKIGQRASELILVSRRRIRS
jgi:hypothetical protein